MTMLPDSVKDATQPLSASPWSAPQPDGPLAQALKRAAARRALQVPGEPDSTQEGSQRRGLEDDIEALAREARARHEAREALAVALQWPHEAAPAERKRGAGAGWTALVWAIAVAAVAAVAAVLLSPPEAGPSPTLPLDPGLKMDQQIGINPRRGGA